MRNSKPMGQGHLSQTSGPAVDYRTKADLSIVRYGPNNTMTNYPSSRVATGRIPDTDVGLKRYLASTDGGVVKTPQIHRASKWNHGDGAFSQTHTNLGVGGSGPSQRPHQAKIARGGKRQAV